MAFAYLQFEYVIVNNLTLSELMTNVKAGHTELTDELQIKNNFICLYRSYPFCAHFFSGESAVCPVTSSDVCFVQ